LGRINAFSEALKVFERNDPAVMASNAGAEYNPGTGRIRLQYVNIFVEVNFPTGEIYTDGESLSRNEEALIIHYLVSACGVNPRDSWLSFIQLPDGPHHHNPFVLDALKPIAADFGDNLELFRERVLALGGIPNGMGDFGAVIYVFPKIQIAVCLWAGDDEFPGNANILFDITAPMHLKTDELFVLGIEISRKIRRVSGQQFV